MKKTVKLLWAVSLLLTGLVILSAGCKDGKQRVSFRSVYYANYGEWFAFPEADSVRATAADGGDALVEGNKLFVDDTDDYALVLICGGKEYESVLKVNAVIAPDIYVSQNIAYGVAGEETALPAAVAHDGVQEIPVEKNVYFGETSVDISQGFFPETAGNYEYAVTAQVAGKTFEKRIPVYIESAAEKYADKIVSFDKPYGLEQMAFADDKISYSEDFAVEDESGSTRMSVATKYSGDILLVNTECEDVTCYDAIYFYVYNDSDVDLSLAIFWAQWVELAPRAWTEILIETDEIDEMIATGAYPTIKENVSAKNINGFYMSVNISDYEDYIFNDDALYFSSIRGLTAAGVDALNERIDKVCAAGALTLRDATFIEYGYSNLKETEKARISEYAFYKQLKIDKILQDADVEKKEDKILYFDNAIGLTQIMQPWTDYAMETTDEMTYFGEGVLKISVTEKTYETENADICFEIVQPFLYDLSGYDYVTFGIYYDSDKEMLLYNDDSNFKNIGSACRQQLKPNQWNEIVLSLGDNDEIENSYFWVISDDSWSPFGTDFSFYVSSFYAGNGNPDLSGYKVPFDEETGSQYLSVYNNAAFAYSEEVKYGDEQGSTRVFAAENADGGQLYLNIENSFEKSVKGYAVFSMYVYYEGTHNYTVYFIPKGYYDLNLAVEQSLKSGEWTKVVFYLPEGKTLSEYGIMVMDAYNGWKFYSEDAVYFSALRFERFNEQDGIAFDSPYVSEQIEVHSNALLTYTEDVKYEGETGSTKISAADDANGYELYFHLRNSAAVTQPTIYSMYVYNAGSRDYVLNILLKGYYPGAEGANATAYVLKKNEWTKVEYLLTEGDSFARYSMMIANNWTFTQGDELYFSALKPERIVEVNGIEFDKEIGEESLFTVWNGVASFNTEIKYEGEAGSTEISVKPDGNGKQIYMNFECFNLKVNKNTEFTFNVYYDGDYDYTIYIMKTNYWNPASALTAVSLRSGEWTEVSFEIPAGTALDDYSFMIMDESGNFAAKDKIYLSALIKV